MDEKDLIDSLQWNIYTASSSLKQRFLFHCHGMVEDVQLTKEFGFQSDAQEIVKFLFRFFGFKDGDVVETLHRKECFGN